MRSEACVCAAACRRVTTSEAQFRLLEALAACLAEESRAMESDSFLEILSPGFNDFDLAWEAPEATQAPTPGWLSDGFLNTEGVMSEDSEEDAEEGDSDGASAGASCQRPASAVNGTILSDASETYSSVLKLSDIASALHNFSRATLPPSTHSQKTSGTPLQKPASEHGIGSGPLCSSPRDSSLVTHSPSQNTTSIPVDTSVMQAHPAGSVPMDHADAASTDNAQTRGKLSRLVGKLDEFNMQRIECSGANEKESSSKLTSDGGSGWDASDTECDEDDAVGSTYGKDRSPCISHVRIIRRPNSSCGQALAPPPKRLKLDHVKAEVTSSSETANVQDDKDCASILSRKRKEGMSQREVHILSERQRRKSMRESFSILQSLVPKLKLKHADRITVLTEVITYIQSLRGTLEELERKKADMMDLLGLTSKATADGHQADVQGTVTYVNTNGNGSSDEKIGSTAGGWCSLQNGERVAMVEVTVRICGADVFVTLSTPQCRGVWSGVLLLLHKYSIDVSNATLATSGDSSFHCIHAKATNLTRIEGVDIQEKLEGVIIKELRRPAKKGQF